MAKHHNLPWFLCLTRARVCTRSDAQGAPGTHPRFLQKKGPPASPPVQASESLGSIRQFRRLVLSRLFKGLTRSGIVDYDEHRNENGACSVSL